MPLWIYSQNFWYIACPIAYMPLRAVKLGGVYAVWLMVMKLAWNYLFHNEILSPLVHVIWWIKKSFWFRPVPGGYWLSSFEPFFSFYSIDGCAGVGTTSSAMGEDGILDIDTTISLETTWHAMENLVSMGLVRSIGIR